VQDPNHAKPKQTKENNKNQMSYKVQTGPTVATGPQACKIETNNKNQQPMNQQTKEQATTTELENNICISNEYQIAAEAQKEPKTYDEHASRNKQTFLLANYKH
jgi:hypothetical protein